jgi:DNA polymerase I-like protein with 3'-5' exonuclease and polymerase domains
MTKLKLVQFNPGSRDHIAKVLKEQYDWKPEVFTDTGKPEISEVTLEGAHYPPVPKLIEYLLLSKRISNLETGPKAWMKFVDEHGLMHPVIYHNHAVTHRGGHTSPNITQAPKVGNPYGQEWRSLVHAPVDWTQMGVDVSGLELRCLAHYLARYDGGAYGKIVCDPTQKIHALHQQMMGGNISYDVAKIWFYAYIYGAGDEKLGKIVDPGATPDRHRKLGRKYRNLFQKKMRAMGLLQETLAQKVDEQGYILLIDGRRAYIRSPHAALNTLLQGTGSIICKNWINDWKSWMEAQYGPQVGYSVLGREHPRMWRKYGTWAGAIWAHDEIQAYLHKDLDHQLISEKCVEVISWQQDKFNFRVPLTGEAKLGRDWASTH